MGAWVQATHIEEESDQYKFEPHAPTKTKTLPWVVCKYCGLVYFRNKFTQWAIRVGCMNRFHPEHKRIRKQYGKEDAKQL